MVAVEEAGGINKLVVMRKRREKAREEGNMRRMWCTCVHGYKRRK